jgi:hypothetical protein
VVALTALSDVIQSNIRPDGIIRSDFLLQKTTVLEQLDTSRKPLVTLTAG